MTDAFIALCVFIAVFSMTVRVLTGLIVAWEGREPRKPADANR